MSALFRSCLAAMATLLKKQKPIACNVMRVMVMILMKMGNLFIKKMTFSPPPPLHGGQVDAQGQNHSRAANLKFDTRELVFTKKAHDT